VVLDEAHVIKNRQSLTFRACLALQATHRWCLTGTPLQNSADDVQPLMAFLRVAPLADHAVWQQYIGKPIRHGDALGLARLRVAMRAVSLRRSNAVLASSLPPITVQTHSVTMEGEERLVYDLLFVSARAAFMALDAHGDTAVMQQYTSVLECLLRLRQACSSGSIIPAARLARARMVLQRLTGSDDPYALPQPSTALGTHEAQEPVIKAKLTAEEAAKILKTLTAIQEAQHVEGESYSCAVCLDDLTDAATRRVLRVCAHAFCADCVERLVADAEEAKRAREGSAGLVGGVGASASCPLCRTLFTSADIFSALEISNASSAADPVPDEGGAGEEPGAGADAEASDGPKQEGLLGSPEASSVGMGGREEGVEGKVDGGEEREAGGEERVEERGQSVSPKIHALIADLEEAIENAGAHGRGANMSSVGGRTEDGRGEESTAAEQGIGGVGVGGGGGDIKAVVFSQFLGCLDEVGAALARSGLAFGRLQGNLSLEQRREVRGARCAYVVEYLRLCRCADIKTQ
jgi:SNF2 family DNA or RNA helicase